MQSRSIQWGVVVLFALALLGVVTTFGVGLMAGTLSLIQGLFSSDSAIAQQGLTYTFSLLAIGMLMVPATYLSFRKLSDPSSGEAPLQIPFAPWQIAIVLPLLAITLFLGYLTIKKTSFAWLIVPVLTVPAVLMSTWLVLGLLYRKLPFQTRWRAANIFALSLGPVPLLIMIVEVIVFIFLFIGFVFYVVSNPALEREMGLFVMQADTIQTAEQAIELLAPYIFKPGFIAALLVVISLIVPLIEEAMKPLAVWFFINKLSGPAEGFTAGVLCGMGFAVMETLGQIAGAGENWAGLILARAGTGLMHMLASGLIGYGIYFAWHQRRWSRLLGLYLVSAMLHGLWNALAIGVSLSALGSQLGLERVNAWVAPTVGGISIFAIGLIVAGWLVNKKLRGSLASVPVKNDYAPSLEGESGQQEKVK